MCFYKKIMLCCLLGFQGNNLHASAVVADIVTAAIVVAGVAVAVGPVVEDLMIDVSSVYHSQEEFHQNILNDSFKVSNSIDNQFDLQCFFEQVTTGVIDCPVVMVDEYLLMKKSKYFDRSQQRIQALFSKARKLAPSIIAAKITEQSLLVSPARHNPRAADYFLQELRSLQASGDCVLVDESMFCMKDLSEHERSQLKHHLLPCVVSKSERVIFFKNLLQRIKVAQDVDQSVLSDLVCAITDRNMTIAQMISMPCLAQKVAQQDRMHQINFKHWCKAVTYDMPVILLVNFFHDKRRTAYHEAGHALMIVHGDLGYNLLGASILPYSNHTGATLVSIPESKTYSNLQRENRIKMLVAGAIAEQEFGFAYKKQFANVKERIADGFFGGAASDLNLAFTIAYELIDDLDKLSESQGRAQAENIFEDHYMQTVEYIHNHRNHVTAIAELLLKEEVVSGGEIRNLLAD